MSYSLGYFQSLCMKILWMYKRDTVKGSYSSGRESERSGGYAGDDVYGGYSGKSSSYDGGYAGCSGDLYRVCRVYDRGLGVRDTKGNQSKGNDKKAGGDIKLLIENKLVEKKSWLYKIRWYKRNFIV